MSHPTLQHQKASESLLWLLIDVLAVTDEMSDYRPLSPRLTRLNRAAQMAIQEHDHIERARHPNRGRPRKEMAS
jgi:hypothetical protein